MKEKKPMKKGSIWRIIYPYLTAYGVNLLVSLGAGLVCSFRLISEKGLNYFENFSTDTEVMNEVLSYVTEFITANSNLLTIFLSVITIPLMLLFLRMDRKRLYAEGEYVTYETPAPLKLGAALLLGAFAAVTFNNLLNLSGLVEKYYEEMEYLSELVYTGDVLVEIVAVIILAPISEELIFRGLTFRRLREVMPLIPAMLLSSLIFGYYHGNLIQGIYAFGIGMLCAFVMERYQNIWASVLVHMGANTVSVLLSETSILSGINTDTAVIIYMAVFAVALVVILAYIHDHVEAKVLIPAGKDRSEAAAGEEEKGESYV